MFDYSPQVYVVRASPPWALFFSDPFPNSAFESLFWTFLHVQVTSDPHRGRFFWFENGRAIKYFTLDENL